MKKLIISLSITLILFTTLYFLIEEKVLKPTNTHIRNIIGRYIEKDYLDRLNIMKTGFERFSSILKRKIEYTANTIKSDRIGKKSGEKELASITGDFIAANPYCKRIRIVNHRLELLFSTVKNDIVGSKLGTDIYGELFANEAEEGSALIVDPVLENLVFYSPIGGERGERYRILFYFTQSVLDPVFMEIESLKYGGFLVTTDKILLVNFPEIDISDEKNLEDLVNMMSESQNGAVRVSLKGYDKIVYYRRVEGDYKDWTIGLTVDMEGLRISKVGAFILILQALVVFSLILFVLTSIRQRRGPIAVTSSEKLRESEAMGLLGQTTLKEAGDEEVTSGSLSPEEIAAEGEVATGEREAKATTSHGILSLSDVEEVTVVEEIGEAEVADEVEEAEPEEAEEPEELESVGHPSEEELEGAELEEIPQAEEAEHPFDEELEETEPGEIGELATKAAHGELSTEEELERVLLEGEEEAKEVEAEREEHFASSPTIEEIERKAGEHGRISLGLDTGEEKMEIEAVSEIETDESIEDDLTKLTGPSGSIEDNLPELEKLVLAGYAESGVDSVQDETWPIIPEEIFKEREKVQKDDELSELITTIESTPSVLEKAFRDFMEQANIPKGALLFKDRAGRYVPAVLHGLSEETRSTLFFKGRERFLNTILERGKMLHVVENPFHSPGMQSRFIKEDRTGIQRLFFAPVFSAHEMTGIILLCMEGEIYTTDMDDLIERIKTIKTIISSIL